MKIDFSIIVPTTRPFHQILPTLEGLGEQELPEGVEWEVLVVINGIQALFFHAPEVPPVSGLKMRFIREPRDGLVQARHRGAQEAVGEVLVFLDDDVIPCRGWLASLYEAFKDFHSDLAGGKVLPRYLADPPLWMEDLWREDEVGRWMYHLSLADLGDEIREVPPQYIFGCNYAIRKGALFSCGGFHPDAFPDSLLKFRGDGEFGLALKLAAHGIRALYHPGACVYHVIPPGRLTKRYACYRSFLQGISDSFTGIRRSGGPVALSRVNMERIAHARGFFQELIREDWQPPDRDDGQMAWWAEYCKQQGFWWHQGNVIEDPLLLAYVMRPDYWTPHTAVPDPREDPHAIFRRKAEALFRAAMERYSRCRYQEALSLLDEAMYWDCDQPELQHLRAVCLLCLGRVSEASLMMPSLGEAIQDPEAMRALEGMMERARGRERILAIPTQLTFNERMLLLDLAKAVPPGGVIVEVGSYLGGSSSFLAEGARARGARVYCVDTWHNDAMPEGNWDTFSRFLENTRDYSGVIVPLRGLSAQIGEGFPHEVDLLFIDADHTYEACKRDLECWLMHLRPAGILVLHDYGWAEGVKRAAHEVLSPKDLEGGTLVDSLFWTRISGKCSLGAGGEAEGVAAHVGQVEQTADPDEERGLRPMDPEELNRRLLDTAIQMAGNRRVELSWVDNMAIEPKAAVIYLTERCNSRCNTCSSWRLPQVDPLDTDAWISILEAMQRGGIQRVEFVGGEPLMREDLAEIVSVARAQGYGEILVSTNGLLLSEKRLDELVAAGATQFHLSLDGTRDTYQRMRGVDGFPLVLRALELLSQRDVPTWVLTNLARQNMGELERILALCQFYKAKWFPNLLENRKYLFEGVDIGNYLISDPKEVERCVDILKRIMDRYPQTCIMQGADLKYIEAYLKGLPQEGLLPCTLGFWDVHVDPRGRLYSSCIPLGSVGNLIEHPIQQVLQGKAMRENLKRMLQRKCPGCTCGYSQRAHLLHMLEGLGVQWVLPEGSGQGLLGCST